MDDLISRKALEEDLRAYSDRKHYNGQTELANGILKAISRVKEAPAVDAVEVVRCFKCKWSERMESPYGTVVHCHRWNKTVDYDGFCYEGY